MIFFGNVRAGQLKSWCGSLWGITVSATLTNKTTLASYLVIYIADFTNMIEIIRNGCSIVFVVAILD